MQLRLNRSVPVLPAPTLPDMERDRRIKSIASLSRVPLLRDLERCIATLAGTATSGHFPQLRERQLALEEISALLEDSAYGGVGSSRAGGRSFRSTAGP